MAGGGSGGIGSLYIGLSLQTAQLTAGVNAASKILNSFNRSAMKSLNGASVGKGLTASLGRSLSFGFFGGLGARAGMAFTGAFTSSIGGAMDFEKSMSRVKSLSGATAGDMSKLSDEAVKLGSTTAFSATEIGQAMGNIAQAGFEKPVQILSMMPGLLSLAAAGEIGLAEGAEIVARSLNQFGLKAENTGAVVNRIVEAANRSQASVAGLGTAFSYVAPSARAAGIGVSDALAGIMGVVGSLGEERAGRAMRGMFESMAKPTQEAVQQLDDLGLSFTKADGSLKPLSVIVDEFSAKIGNASNKSTVLATIMGDANAKDAFLALMNTGGDQLRKFQEQLDNSGQASAVAAERLDNVSGAFKRVKGAVESVGIQIYNGFKGQAKDGLLDFAGLLNSVKPLAEEVGKAIGRAMTWVSENVSLAVFAFQNMGPAMEIFKTSAMLSIQRLGTSIAYWLGDVPKAIFDWLGSAGLQGFTNLAANVFQIFQNLVSNIRDSLSGIKFNVTTMQFEFPDTAQQIGEKTAAIESTFNKAMKSAADSRKYRDRAQYDDGGNKYTESYYKRSKETYDLASDYAKAERGAALKKLERKPVGLMEGTTDFSSKSFALPEKSAISQSETDLTTTLNEQTQSFFQKFETFQKERKSVAEKIASQNAAAAIVDNTLPPVADAMGEKINLDMKKTGDKTAGLKAKEFGGNEAISSIQARISGASEGEKSLAIQREILQVNKKLLVAFDNLYSDPYKMEVVNL